MDNKVFSGKYTIEGEIARGGMGVIYKAVHTTLNRQVAIKVLHPQYSGDPAFLKRFMREARAMAKLDHDNIIRVFDVSEDNEAHYIVMEYFSGKDLKRLLLEKGRFQTQEMLSIIIQVTSALYYAHTRGIVHRDIKLGNIMVDNQGRAKIADFGIAAAADEISVTVTGQIIGTPEYMSPEQARGEHLDGRSDLYSLGVVIYEMLTGQTPYEGVSRMAIVGKLLYDQEDVSLSFPPDVPVQLQDLIRHLLKKKLDERIPDAAVLLSRIREVAAEAGLLNIPEVSIPLTQPVSITEEDTEGPTVMLRETEIPTPHFTPTPSPKPTPTPAPTPTKAPTSTPSPTPTPPPSAAPTYSSPSPPSQPPPAFNATMPKETYTPPAATPYTPSSQEATPAKKQNFITYIIAGVAGVVIVIGGVLYFLSSTGEKISPTPVSEQRQGTDDTGTVSLAKIRETQIAIRNIQEQISKSISDADSANAKRLAPKIYNEAVNLKNKGMELFQEGGALINSNQYKEAAKSMDDSLSLLTQANDGFIRAIETATEQTVKKEKEKAEKAKLAKKTPPKQPEQKKEKQTTTATVPTAQPATRRVSTPADTTTNAPPSRPDIEVVGEILSKLKRAYEGHNMSGLHQIADMSEGRTRFLQQLFKDYPTIRVSIADFSLTSDSATAIVSITKLIDKNGETLTPDDKWKQSKIIIRKEGGEWGKIIW